MAVFLLRPKSTSCQYLGGLTMPPQTSDPSQLLSALLLFHQTLWTPFYPWNLPGPVCLRAFQDQLHLHELRKSALQPEHLTCCTLVQVMLYISFYVCLESFYLSIHITPSLLSSICLDSPSLGHLKWTESTLQTLFIFLVLLIFFYNIYNYLAWS